MPSSLVPPQMIKEDFRSLYRQTGGSHRGRIIACLRSPGLYGVLIFRFRHWLREQNVVLRILLAPFSMYLDRRMRMKWGIEIHSGATIGEGFAILHHGGIFISSKSVIGKNFSLAHDVTIGTAGTGDRAGAPVIGDNVAINPGAKVHGKIRIGDNVHIGPNAVVNKSIPDNALVHTPPMKVVVFPGLYGGAGKEPGPGKEPVEERS